MTKPVITLGINVCFAVKRWARPADWCRIVADDLGLSAVQFSLDLLPLSPTSDAATEHVHEVAEVSRERGIEIRSVFTGLAAYASNLLLSDSAGERDEAERWYEHVIDLTAIMSAPGAGGHVGAYTVASFNDPQRRTELWSDLTTRLHRLARRGADTGLEYMLFENLAVSREPGYSITQAHELEGALDAAAIPWRLCLDLGHPAALGTGSASDEPTSWLREEWTYTPVVQVQQSPRGEDRHGAFTRANNLHGLVRREEVLPALLLWGVPEVELHIEVIPAHETPDFTVIQELIESVEYWREGIEQVLS